jgi:hypothetical protein
MPDPYQQELIEARMNIVRLETTVTHLTTAVAKMEASQAEMAEKLDAVLLKLSEAQGGWKVMMLFGSAAVTVGGAIGWLLSHLPKLTQ